jgi:hypothetical protein
MLVTSPQPGWSLSGGDIERAVVELVEVEAEKQLLEVGLVAAGGQLGHHGEQEPGNQGYMPLVRAKRSAPLLHQLTNLSGH